MKKWAAQVDTQRRIWRDHARASNQTRMTSTSATEFTYMKDQGSMVNPYAEDDDDDDEGFDEDDDEFADEMSTEWNLRKCAAAALDVLAVRFGPDLLNHLLEPLKTKLWSDDWLQRESGVLALGAMAEGNS